MPGDRGRRGYERVELHDDGNGIYAREFLFVRELYDTGKLGRIQFMRGSHQQEMAGWPGYWEGLPPMHYATHAVSPCLALVRGEADFVTCLGSGRIGDRLTQKYGSPFAVESALFKVRNEDLAFEVTRSLFETARQYRESLDVYGDKGAFEWAQIENEQPVIHVGEQPERTEVPDYARLLPEPIQRFTTKGVYDEEHAHLSFTPRGRTRRLPSAHGPRVPFEYCRGTSVIPRRVPVGELDLRGYLCPRIRDAGRSQDSAPGLPQRLSFGCLS